MDAHEIIYELYIAPFQNKCQKKRLLGLELEFPVGRWYGEQQETKAGQKSPIVEEPLKHFLDKRLNLDLAAREYSAEGYCTRAGGREGVGLSFDSSYLNFEFSLPPAEELNQVYATFLSYFNEVQSRYRELGYGMAGGALNYYAINESNSLPIRYLHNSPYYLEEQFLKRFCKKGQPIIQAHPNFFTVVSAVQTHFDCRIQELPRFLNVMNKLDFVNHLLFDNSLYRFGKTWYLSGRHYLYKNSGFTQLGLAGGTDEEYTRVDDIIKNYARRKLACRLRNGEPAFFLPVSWEEYCRDAKNTAIREDISQVFSYRNTELSRFGTIEHRMMDTQPLCDVFLPSAWMQGLLNCLDETEEVLNRLKKDVFSGYGNTALIDMAVRAGLRPFFLKMGMEDWAGRLYEIARKGLNQRDRVFLRSLEKRIVGLKSPAAEELNRQLR